MAPRDSVARMARLIRACPATEPHGRVISACSRRKVAGHGVTVTPYILPDWITPWSSSVERSPEKAGAFRLTSRLLSSQAVAEAGRPERLLEFVHGAKGMLARSYLHGGGEPGGERMRATRAARFVDGSAHRRRLRSNLESMTISISDPFARLPRSSTSATENF